ncbi:MAG: PAS domain S-box protein [Okeania sp. SIO2D1]|nr:PAS domain S-box protein [Okeania sp. SIO2D1]
MLYHGKVVGYLGLDALVSQRNWTKDEIRLLKMVAEFLAVAQARYKAQRDLRASEGRLAGILDIAKDAIITIDYRQQILIFNQGAENIFGYRSEEVLGKSLDLLIPQQFRGNHQRYIYDFGQSSQDNRRMAERREIFGLRSNGKQFPAEASISQLGEGKGKLFTVILRDITERRQAEERLRQSEERFALSVAGANEGIWDWNIATGEIYFSPRWKKMLGYNDRELPNSLASWEKLLHPQDRLRVLRVLKEYLQGKRDKYKVEYRARHKEGYYLWIMARGSALRDKTGKPCRLSGSHSDITASKNSEEVLKQRAKMDSLLSQVSRAFMNQDLDTAIDFTLRSLGELLKDDRVFVIRYADNQTKLVMTHEWCAPGIESSISFFDNLTVGNFAWSYQRLQYDYLEVGSLKDLPPEAVSERQLFRNYRLQSYIIVPMSNSGQVTGYIGVDAALNPRKWSTEEVNLIKIVGEIVAIAQARAEAEEALRKEQEKSESLLLNILPQPIAQQLKQQQECLAQQFDEVTILFADIVGFTPLSANLSPIDLVNLLNEIFSSFDQLVEKYQLEKIKTIGDAYMVVGGLPMPKQDHAEAIANLALDMQQAISNFQHTILGSTSNLQIRVGINTGTVVAGVIGIKRFIYDLWGDAVNVASRMESSGVPGKIQVTTETYQRLKGNYRFKKRGAIAVKGKGEMITYWLEGRR